MTVASGRARTSCSTFGVAPSSWFLPAVDRARSLSINRISAILTVSDKAMRESLTAVRLTGVSADGATTPETLRPRGPRGWTIWREALQRAHRRGHPRRVVRVKLSGTATDGDRWPACRPGPTL